MPLFTQALNIESGQVGLIPLAFVFAWILHMVMQTLNPMEIQMQLKDKTLIWLRAPWEQATGY